MRRATIRPSRWPRSLAGLIDFAEINAGRTRLTVGAANAHSSAMRYFDSHDMEVSVRHVMASGALPPAFPPVRIDGELYWDGGILSNTPVEAVFDDKPRRNSLVFAVHLWNPCGAEPESMRQVMNRQKELQYSSRAVTHILRQQQIHRLRHIVAELAARLPASELADPEVREMASYGCLTRMHVVRLLAPMLKGEDHTKDIDFSSSGITGRREAGYAHARRVLDEEPWKAEFGPLEGFVLHEAPSLAGAMWNSSPHTPPPSATSRNRDDYQSQKLASAVCVAALLTFPTARPTTAEPLSPALQTDGVIKVKSAYPVDETIARIKQDIAAKGIKFFDAIDQAKLGGDAGIKLRPSTLLIFGNPPLGIQFITSNPNAGLDWPVRLLVMQDEKGDVYAAYTDFAWIAQRHGITDRGAQFKMASSVVSSILSTVSAK